MYVSNLERLKIDFGSEHPSTLSSMLKVASCLGSLGKDQELSRILEEVYEISKRILGPDHPDCLIRSVVIGGHLRPVWED